MMLPTPAQLDLDDRAANADRDRARLEDYQTSIARRDAWFAQVVQSLPDAIAAVMQGGATTAERPGVKVNRHDSIRIVFRLMSEDDKELASIEWIEPAVRAVLDPLLVTSGWQLHAVHAYDDYRDNGFASHGAWFEIKPIPPVQPCQQRSWFRTLFRL